MRKNALEKTRTQTSTNKIYSLGVINIIHTVTHTHTHAHAYYENTHCQVYVIFVLRLCIIISDTIHLCQTRLYVLICRGSSSLMAVVRISSCIFLFYFSLVIYYIICKRQTSLFRRSRAPCPKIASLTTEGLRVNVSSINTYV